MFRGNVRLFLSIAFALSLGVALAGPAVASNVGAISGTVTTTDTGAPVAGATVVAASPSGTVRTTTDAHGFFGMTGVAPDTYTITVEHQGFEPVSLSGVTVVPDQTARADTTLQMSLKTIARVAVRTQAGAYQPHQTADTYTVSGQQIATIVGNPINNSEKSLITALPGVQLSTGNYPTIRGGRTNNVDYEFEGMNYTDPYTQKNINGFKFPTFGLQSVQVSPGSENESFGNSGVGSVNITARRGAYPGEVDLAAGVGSPGFDHTLDFGYGAATRNDRLSEFISYSASNTGPRYGGPYAVGTAANDIGVLGFPALLTDREFLTNTVFKFGRDNRFALQFLYDNGFHRTVGDYGNALANNLCYFACDLGQLGPFSVDASNAYTQNNVATGFAGYLDAKGGGHGLTVAQLQKLLYLSPGQTQIDERLLGHGSYSQNQISNGTKAQFTWNPNASTYMYAGWSTTNGMTTSDAPNSALYRVLGGFNDEYNGGITKQLSARNQLRFNVNALTAKPLNIGFFPNDELFNLSPTFENVGELYDFVSPSDPQCPLGPAPSGRSYCGHLYRALGISGPTGTLKLIPGAAGTRINANGYDYSFGDSWTPNERLKVDAGVRIEHRDVSYPQYGTLPDCTSFYVPNGYQAPTLGTLPDGETGLLVDGKPVGPGNCPHSFFEPLTKYQTNPTVPEPRLAASYEIGPNDALRFSYGRTARFPHGEDSDYAPGPGYADQFAALPAYLNPGVFANIGAYNINTPYKSTDPNDYYGRHGIPTDCGFNGYQVPCQSYQQQIYWSVINGDFPNPLSILTPVTYSNFDLSYSHQFPAGFSFKATGWTRRAYNLDIVEQVPQTDLFGVTLKNPDGSTSFLNLHHATNNGIEIADGLEFYLTREQPFGLSGQLAATYNNVRQNVPPTGADEYHGVLSALPSTQLFRVNYVSPMTSTLALSYHTHDGWRLQTRLDFDIGYPYGNGLFYNLNYGSQTYNVPHTNASGGGQTQFVDPSDPGSAFKPNIAATLGVPEANQAQGLLSHSNLVAEVTLEKSIGKSAIGISVFNLFNEAYSGPTAVNGDFGSIQGGPFAYFNGTLNQAPGLNYNGAYQPVATGVAGPLTGYNTNCTPNRSTGTTCLNAGATVNGRGPYINLPNAIGRQFTFYFTTRL